MKLSLETLRQIKLEYQREYGDTLKRLQELRNVLDQLENVSLPENFLDSGELLTDNKGSKIKKESKKTSAVNKTKEKRGRKSVWGKFIVNRLRSVHRPLTLDELTDHAIVTMKLDPSRFEKTRQSVVSAVFALRKKDKVVTIPIKGSREKMVGLYNWVDDRGKLIDEFKQS